MGICNSQAKNQGWDVHTPILACKFHPWVLTRDSAVHTTKNYCVVPSKHPWALVIHMSKPEVGVGTYIVYTEMLSKCR